MSETLLQIDGLHTHFKTKEGTVKAVNGVSLTLRADSVLGVVGESGAGKTMTALSILRLVPFPGEIVAGSITYMGRDLLNLDREDMRHIRGNDISLIFQDAGAALNPVIPVGRQVEEIMLEHTDMSQRQARSLAIDLLTQMGIPDAKQTLERCPFQLSGGMSQRVMMAIGVALKPKCFWRMSRRQTWTSRFKPKCCTGSPSFGEKPGPGYHADHPRPGNNRADGRRGRRDVRRDSGRAF